MENNSSTVTLKLIGDADEEADMVCEKDELIKESAYFRVMFNGDFVERNQNVIELKDVRKDDFVEVLEVIRKKNPHPITRKNINDNLSAVTVADMLQFKAAKNIYVDYINKLIAAETFTDLDDLLLILITAGKLQSTTIQSRCVAFLEKMINFNNMLYVWQNIEKGNCEYFLAKIRYRVVTNFETIRKTMAFHHLKSEWLFRLLADRRLFCDCEMSVFQAGIDWLEIKDARDVDMEKIIFALLTCLDFSQLSIVDLEIMQGNKYILGYQNLIGILQYIIDVRKMGMSTVQSRELIDKAIVLLKSKRREINGFPTFVYRSSNYDEIDALEAVGLDYLNVQFYYDGNNFKLLYTNDNCRENIMRHNYFGRRIFGYKNLIYYCGEYSIEKKNWMRDIYVYDVVVGMYERRSQMPEMENTFEVVLCGKIAYFINRYDRKRIHVSDAKMFAYHCEKNSWSGPYPILDGYYERTAYCNYNKQLLLMAVDADRRLKAYLFREALSRWEHVPIVTDSDIHVEKQEQMAAFSYNNNVFVKGPYVTEFAYCNNQLREISRVRVRELETYTLADHCLCDSMLFSLYKRKAFQKGTFLEIFCLLTRTFRIIALVPEAMCMFVARHYEICAKEDFVNDYFKGQC